MRTFLRPAVVSVYRKVLGAVGPTGNQTTTVALLYSNVNALVDHATRGVSDKMIFEPQTGVMAEQTDLCFVDGLMPAQFYPAQPGDTVIVNGTAYIVSPDGNGAFIDVQPFDIVVHGTDRYLVLQATRYGDVVPCIQLHLNFGRAWMDALPSPPSLESVEMWYGNGELQLGDTGSFFKTLNGGTSTGGGTEGADWEMTLSGTQILNNGGSFAIGGEAFVTSGGSGDLSRPNTVTIAPTGAVTFGLIDADDPEVSFGGGEGNVLTMVVAGVLTVQGGGSVSFSSSQGSTTVSILHGGGLVTSPTFEGFCGIYGSLTITPMIDFPDDNDTNPPGSNGFPNTAVNGLLTMFTHAQGAGHTVQFTDASYADGSTGVITTWAWDFGDSGTDTSQNPSHTYTDAGTYTVTLTATTNGGMSQQVSASVTVS